MTSTAAPVRNPVLEKGNLAEVPFARVFFGLCRERASGLLDVRDKPAEAGGKIIKRLVTAEGERFAVQGGSRQETLPEILLEKGKLTKEQYAALQKECGGDYGKMEQKVLYGGLVPPGEINDLLTLQLELKIRVLFARFSGFYEFKAQPRDSLLQKNVLLPASPAKILREGVAEFYPPARIKKEFPDIEKKAFTRAAALKEQVNTLGLTPPLQRWLRGLPESFSWQSVTKGAPFKEEELFALLLALYFADLITLPTGEADFPLGKAYLEEEAKAQKKKAAAEAKAAEKTPAPKEATPAPKPAEPKLPIEEMLDKQLNDKEILAEMDRLLAQAVKKEATYFDLLGVQESTPTAKIKQIYFKFARKFHPDARPDLFKGEVKDKVEDLFTKISEAYNALEDGEQRMAYLKQIKSKVSTEDMDLAQRALEAEMEFQKADVLMKKGAWAEALTLLERAAKLQPEEPEFRLYLTWTKFKTKALPEGQARTNLKKELANLEKANRPDAVADANSFLGQLARNDGAISEAIAHFEAAAKLKPYDTEIKRELNLLYRKKDKAPPPEKKGGMFGKKK